MASAKTLLSYFANKCTETQAAQVLDRVGMVFKGSAQVYRFIGHSLVNSEDQNVNIGLGDVIGYDLPPVSEVAGTGAATGVPVSSPVSTSGTGAASGTPASSPVSTPRTGAATGSVPNTAPGTGAAPNTVPSAPALSAQVAKV